MIGDWAGAALLFVLEFLLVAVAFIAVSLAHVIGFVWRGAAGLFGARASAPPPVQAPPPRPDADSSAKD
jgi:hypothetical protein